MAESRTVASLVALLLALVVPSGSASGQEGGNPAEEEVLATVRAFHGALASADSAGAIAVLHRDVVVFEGGHGETLAEYRGGHLPADMAYASATARELTAEAVTIAGEMALYTAESHTTGRWRERDIDARGAETMVLVRTPEGWRIRHIHWSSRR